MVECESEQRESVPIPDTDPPPQGFKRRVIKKGGRSAPHWITDAETLASDENRDTWDILPRNAYNEDTQDLIVSAHLGDVNVGRMALREYTHNTKHGGHTLYDRARVRTSPDDFQIVAYN